MHPLLQVLAALILGVGGISCLGLALFVAACGESANLRKRNASMKRALRKSE